MYTNSSCTIFHKTIINRGDEVIERIFIPECFWDSNKGITTFANGIESANKVQILINDITGYKTPKDYANLVDKTGYWTIANNDKVVEGNIPIETVFSDLEKLYDNVLNVTSIDYRNFGSEDMRHVEVGGK